MRTALLAVTEQGWKTAERIRDGLPDSVLYRYSSGIRQAIERAWHEHDALICVMAAGIVVRCVAGLCSSKFRDPCVLVVDETGTHVISLLSGHIGGGNELARSVAAIVSGTAVLTTASDVSGHTAVDLWSIRQNCTIANPDRLPATSAKLLRTGCLSVFQEKQFVKTLPVDFRSCINRRDGDIVIAQRHDDHQKSLQLIPRIRYIGLGCRRGASVDEFSKAFHDLQVQHGLDLRSVAGVASIDIKQDETGLLEAARLNHWPIRFFSKDEINTVVVPGSSDIVYDKIGVHSVSEATAILAASAGKSRARLIIEKRKWQRLTAAVAETEY